MNIGIMGNALNPKISAQQATGYSIAVDTLINSFFLYSTKNSFTCLAQPGKYHWDRVHYLRSLLPKERQKEICIVDENELLFQGMESLMDLDILHSLRGDVLSTLALRESLGRPIPMTFTLHGISEQHLLLDTFLPMLIFSFRPYDAILCTSEAVRCTVQRILNRLKTTPALASLNRKSPLIRLEKVPLGVNVDYFRPMNKEKARQNLHLPQNAFIILWFGRFSCDHKADLYPLFHLFRRLLNRFPQKQLFLLLAGCSSSDLKQQEFLEEVERCKITPYVRLILNNEIHDRAELYNACDVFTSPVDNIQETFGLTPVEAMACGIPQVVSDWDGYRDTVLDGQTGFLISTVWTNCMDDLKERDFLPLDGAQRSELYASLVSRSVAVDLDAFEEKICIMIKQPELRHRMSINSRIRAVEHFSLQSTVAQTEAIWENLSKLSREESSYEKMNIVDLCNDFQGYPTQMVSDDCSFAVTEDGLAMKNLPIRHRHIPTSEDALPPLILKLYQQGQHYSFSDLIFRFPKYTPSQIKRSVMYLYKCGFIRRI